MIDLDEPPPTAGPSFYGNPLNKMPQLGRGLVNGKSPLRAKNMDGELAKVSLMAILWNIPLARTQFIG